MKINISFVALLGLAIPWVVAAPITTDVADGSMIILGNILISARQDGDDDEWQMVAYSGSAVNGGPCTGTSETITGTSSDTNCKTTSQVKTVACVDLKINVGFVACKFLFSRESTGCSSSIPADNTVNVSGNETITQNVDSTTLFSVECDE